MGVLQNNFSTPIFVNIQFYAPVWWYYMPYQTNACINDFWVALYLHATYFDTTCVNKHLSTNEMFLNICQQNL